MAGLNLNLNAFTENASRLGARISETINEHTRDFAITRSPGATYFDAPEEKVRNVRKQLDANSDRDKLDALKTLIALISKGRNVSEFFPYVVKNVASQNLEIRKLVYIFLLRYAESDPDLALLSINTFQKDLADSNPLIRAMALRVLSGINVPMIGNIVVLAIKKCASDPSPYVRKAAALALIKCYNMDSAHLPSLIPILSTLLKDKSPLSIGTVAVAFSAVCPTRFDLLHKHYRRLCRMLIDADAWGQVSILDLLARYARSMLSRPTTGTANVHDGVDEEKGIDPDLELLLSSAEPLFMSRNPAVVIAVTRAFLYLAPPSQLQKLVNPLLSLLAISKEVERVALAYLVIITAGSPELFTPHYTRFLIRTTDIPPVKQDKLRILLKLVTLENYQAILREFVVYADDPDEQLVSGSVLAIGRCAKVIPDSAPQCLSALMEFIKSGSESAISASVLVLKSLVQSQLQSETLRLPGSQSPVHIIADLASRIDEIKHPSARACVVWLVGQYSTVQDEEQTDSQGGIFGMALWAPDVLRRIAKTFTSEASIVKLQVVTLAAKLQVIASDNHILNLLTHYVFSMARYDADYDVRDRARMLSALLAGVTSALHISNGDGVVNDEVDSTGRSGVVLRREQVRLVLFNGKLGVQEKEIHSSGESDVIGSLEVITGKPMGLESNRRLPDWLEEGTDPSLRDAEDEYPSVPISTQAPRAIAGGFASNNLATPIVLTPAGGASPMGSFVPQGGPSNKGAWVDLDKFYEDADSDEEEDDESEDDEISDVEQSPFAAKEEPTSLQADASRIDDNGESEDEEGGTSISDYSND